MKKNIYILGGEGFIGLNLSEYFGKLGKYNVILISNRKTIFDLPNDIKVTRKYFNIYDCNFKIEDLSIVIHLARKNSIDINDFEKNEIKLRDYILKFNPYKIITFSSSIVYTYEINEYKEEKKKLEEIWKDFSLIVRLFNTYGKYQYPKVQGSLIVTSLYNFLTGGITTLNNINQSRNFIYAGDIGLVIDYCIFNNINGIIDLGNIDINFKNLFNDYLFNIISNESVNILGSNNDGILNLNPQDSFDINYTNLEDGLKITFDFLKNNINKYENFSYNASL